MIGRLTIVALAAFALAGCQMAAPSSGSAPAAASGDTQTETWIGPDGCIYRMTLVGGQRTNMELVSRGAKGPCVGA